MLTSIRVQERDVTKRSNLQTLRKKGYIPSVIYGKDVKGTPIAVEQGELQRVIRQQGKNALVQLEVTDKKLDAMIQDLQFDPISRHILHVDFKTIRQDDEVVVTVPIRIVGEAQGIKAGGVLEQQLEQIQVRCLPRDIPEVIEHDISALQIDDLLRVSDLTLPPNLENRSNPEEVIVKITQPRLEPVEEEDVDTPEAPKMVEVDD